MTADADGHLYAFIGPWVGNETRVDDLDKKDAGQLRTWPLPMLNTYGGPVAIGAWGHALWLFAAPGPTGSDSTSAVFRLDPASGNLTQVIADTGRHIIGAGVAPCG